MKTKVKEYINVTFKAILLMLGMFFFVRIFRNNFYFQMIAPLESVNPVLYEGLRYLGHILFLVFIALYFMLDKNDRTCCLKSARFNKKSILLILLGLVCGFAMNGGSILSAIIHGDMDMAWQSFNPVGLVFIFLCVAVQSSTEEVQFRLWGHTKIAAKAPLGYATIGSALAFAMVHMLNDGITVVAFMNIFLVAILYSLSLHYFGNIWFCCAHHTAWNFTQNCVFGLPNSGIPAVITIAAPSYTNQSFFYDPVFGVEGTLFTSIICIVAIIVFLILIKCKKNRLDKVKKQC